MTARRLRGGLGARTQVLNIEHADGRREKAVLRVYLPGHQSGFPEQAEREFRIIGLVQNAGIPAARPLFLDANGTCFDQPSMLLSYVPGRSMYRQEVPSWTGGLAAAMHSIHDVTPQQYDLSWLPRFGRKEIEADLDSRRVEVLAHEDDVAREVMAAIENTIALVDWLPPCLIHDDFWPGNTVWYRGKLLAVIDWVDAKVGDPRVDLAQCRLDVLLVNDIEMADALAEAYEAAAREPLQDLWFFDLLLGLRALLQYKIWLIGYHDAGLTVVTDELAHERIIAFLRRALEQASIRASRP